MAIQTSFGLPNCEWLYNIVECIRISGGKGMTRSILQIRLTTKESEKEGSDVSDREGLFQRP